MLFLSRVVFDKSEHFLKFVVLRLRLLGRLRCCLGFKKLELVSDLFCFFRVSVIEDRFQALEQVPLALFKHSHIDLFGLVLVDGSPLLVHLGLCILSSLNAFDRERCLLLLVKRWWRSIDGTKGGILAMHLGN